MSSTGERLRDIQVRLLAVMGEDATLTSQRTVYDSNLDAMVPLNGVSKSVRVKKGSVTKRLANGVETEQTVMTLLVEPARGDTIKLGKDEWTVGNVKVHAFQGIISKYVAEVS